MKKILVTGPFEGEVTLVYGDAGVGEDWMPRLTMVDMTSAVLEDKQRQWMLACVPVRYGAGYEQNWGQLNNKFRFVTEDYEVDFERDFWNKYDNKKNKDRSIKEWGRMSRTERVLAVGRLSAYLRYLARKGFHKAGPEKYLTEKYWKNDYDNL